ncbi:MAG TPA: hypothetical protein PK264_12725, partial [Hyphomicrobiaceae bacterium]|nr:hypothetical protein [Hyphomicrobiaceae bacterium]
LASIPVRPRIDKATKQSQADIVDPDRIAGALSALRGQTALIVARRDGERLVIQPQRGGERAILIKDVVGAATTGDVNLMVLASAAPRQPSGRNWLWLKVEVPGLDHAAARPTVGDMLAALAGKSDTLAVAVTPVDADRIILKAQRIGDLGAEPSRVGAFLDEMATAITGNVGIDAIEGWMTSRSRAGELRWRLVPGVPSIVQWGWLALIAAGLVALPVARRWFAALWPPEERSEYAAWRGYAAAVAMRCTLLVALFLPLAGLPALLAGALALSKRIVTRS